MTTERIQVVIDATDNASPKLRQFNQELGKTNTAADKTSKLGGIFKNMSTEMQGAIAGIGLMKVADTIGDLNKLGMEAEATRTIFTRLAGGAGEADKLLNQLKTTTRNVVTDVDLMAGANQLMRMGLAENATEVEKLINIAVKLKKPTESAAEAIDNFSLMLANNSRMRLDSFGMSSSRVGIRIDELLKSGQALARDEAFKMAVMEEGAIALERLGEAANVSDTAFARLQTRLGNIATELGRVTAQGLEAGSQLVELGFIAANEISQGNGTDFINATLAAVASEVTGVSTSHIYDSLSGTTQYPGAMPRSRGSGDMAGTVSMTANDRNKLLVEGGLGGLSRHAVQGIIRQVGSQLNQSTNGLMDMFMGMGDITPLGLSFAQGRARGSRLTPGQGITALNNMNFGTPSLEGILGSRFISQFQNGMSGASSGLRNIGSFDRLFGMTQSGFNAGQGNMGLMRDDVITQTIDRVEKLRAIQKEIEESPFISDADKDRLAGLADEADQLADAAQRARENFDNMNLDQMLGKGSGGRIGELTDLVMENLTEDMKDEDVEKVKREFDLGSGRETALSLRTQDVYAPLLAGITERQGANAGFNASQAVLGAIERGQSAGLSQDQIMGAANFEMFKASAPGLFGKGEALFGAIGGMFGGADSGEGGGIDKLATDAEAAFVQIADLSGAMEEVATHAQAVKLDGLSDSIGVSVSAMEEAMAMIEEFASRTGEVTLTVRINTVYDDPTTKKMLATGTAKMANDNGGAIPEL